MVKLSKQGILILLGIWKILSKESVAFLKSEYICIK